jgi:hypothetical protein
MTKTLLMAYDGHSIQFRDDGWFNATTAAAKFGKDPYEWLRLPETLAYLHALERKYGKIPYYTARRGKNGGTWMHPKLGVSFARWLDIDFSVWADEQIERLIHGTPEETDWTRLRHEAASSYKVMSDVLLERRTEDGKETKPYHYANEAKLVNFAMTGDFRPLDRESLPTADLNTLAKLESRNAVLLAKGASRELRKELLTAMVENRRAKLELVQGDAK